MLSLTAPNEKLPVHDYLREQAQAADAVQREIESHQDSAGLRERGAQSVKQARRISAKFVSKVRSAISNLNL